MHGLRNIKKLKTVLCPHFTYCISLLVPVFVTNKGSGPVTQVIQNVVTVVCVYVCVLQASIMARQWNGWMLQARKLHYGSTCL